MNQIFVGLHQYQNYYHSKFSQIAFEGDFLSKSKLSSITKLVIIYLIIV